MGLHCCYLTFKFLALDRLMRKSLVVIVAALSCLMCAPDIRRVQNVAEFVRFQQITGTFPFAIRIATTAKHNQVKFKLQS